MIAPQDRPHLSVVNEASQAGEGRVPALSPTPGDSRSRWLPVLLGVVLAACALGWILEARSANRLGAELAATHSALSLAEGRLAAHRAHLVEVRDQAALVGSQLGSLAEQVTALEALAGTDPSAAINPAEPPREAVRR